MTETMMKCGCCGKLVEDKRQIRIYTVCTENVDELRGSVERWDMEKYCMSVDQQQKQ